MGRSTFEPALSAPHWPWEQLDVFVLGSQRPDGTPDRVVVDNNPARLLERIRRANRGGDVHLVGGPRTIETFRGLGALDEFRLLVLPMLAGTGRHLAPDVDRTARLAFIEAKPWPTGVVELIYRADLGPHAG
jgi:dihydrofolate reductase